MSGEIGSSPVQDAHAERAEILYEVREQRKKIDRLEEVVSLGNGHRPLTERVTTLEAEVNTIKENFDEVKGDIRAIRKNQSTIIWKILGGVAALLAVFLAATLAYVFKTNMGT